jgi:hypothetical protein
MLSYSSLTSAYSSKVPFLDYKDLRPSEGVLAESMTLATNLIIDSLVDSLKIGSLQKALWALEL